MIETRSPTRALLRSAMVENTAIALQHGLSVYRRVTTFSRAVRVSVSGRCPLAVFGLLFFCFLFFWRLLSEFSCVALYFFTLSCHTPPPPSLSLSRALFSLSLFSNYNPYSSSNSQSGSRWLTGYISQTTHQYFTTGLPECTILCSVSTVRKRNYE